MNNAVVSMGAHGGHGSNGGFYQNGFVAMNTPQQQQQVATQFLPPNACRRCHSGGCDVKIQDCGCLFHAVRYVTLWCCGVRTLGRSLNVKDLKCSGIFSLLFFSHDFCSCFSPFLLLHSIYHINL